MLAERKLPAFDSTLDQELLEFICGGEAFRRLLCAAVAQGVIAAAAVEQVVAGAAVEHIIVRLRSGAALPIAGERVGAVIALKKVVPRAAEEPVAGGAADEGVVAAAAPNRRRDRE